MIKYISGDITLFSGDVIVNAANVTLMGGGGVDGAIHLAAGDSVLAECISIPKTNGIRCNIGDIVVTKAGDLDVDFIFHTVGPIYTPDIDSKILSSCYINALEAAITLKCKSIAFPEISTGVYGYPKNIAKEIVSLACLKYKDKIDIYLYSF